MSSRALSSRKSGPQPATIAAWAPLVLFATTLSADEQLPDPLAAGWKGSAVCEKLHEDKEQRILRCTFPPGVGHEKHFHAPHFGYAIRGGKMRLRDDDGEREVEVPANYSWTKDDVSWHEVLNIGETTSVYLIIEAL